MGKHATRWVPHEHPTWCIRQSRASSNHDPHTSAAEWVAEDFPSDLTIDAYLLRYRKPITRDPEQALAALEFRQPGEETAQFLLTFGQLRRLSEGLARLVRTGQIDSC